MERPSPVGRPQILLEAPHFCPTFAGVPLFCRGHFSFARDTSSGGALPLRGTSLSCQRHPFSSYGAPLFAWAPLFCSERGTTLLLLGHSPSAGVALPLSSGAPLLVEYTPFLFVMGRPSSTGGAHLLLGRLSSAGYCQWGAHILFGGPNLCWRLPISD